MITDWELLVEALREEVQEYGGLLNLFDQQQAAILRREPDTVLAVNDSIEMQVEIINRCRNQREVYVQKCAAQVHQPSRISVRDLVPFFSESVRPLMNALIDEVNGLVARARRRAQQNQMLLARSIEVTQKILHRLNPGAVTTTYSQTGHVSVAVSGSRSRLMLKS